MSVRNPRDVVHSIHLRDKIPQERILKIWLRYNFDAIRHSLDRLRAIVVFENWFQDFDAELSYLTQALDIDLTEATKTEILKIIQPQLKHEPSKEWNIPLWAEWAYQSILSLREKDFDSTFTKQLLTDFEWLLFRLQQGEDNPSILENKKRLALVFSSPADEEAWGLAKRLPKDQNLQVSLLLAEGTPEKEFSSAVAGLGMAIGQLPFDESPELLSPPICTKAIRPPFALYSYLKNRYYDQIILPVAKGIAFFALEAVHLPCLSSTEILLYGTTKHNENAYPNIENYLSFALEKETLTLSNKKDNPTDPQKDTPLLSICYVLHGEKQPPTAFPTNESIEWLFGMDEQRAIETSSSPTALSNGVYQLFFPPWTSFLDRWKSLVR
ncbi:hypothetical protein [Methylacidiphilum caldifontis]|uniref:Uncharacterized protein n=1 Tax=Methylacidiphilum caldifontis TaxID=2795386 RepID=A0A4Y8PBY2_9BACT|nr:hypothetical protein [Methylacidiphilum caldifontis]TFE68169.1 hypothetical protein A7Q10_00575 [Methylacidiphilum caldifontis]